MNISYLYQYLIDIAESDPRDQNSRKPQAHSVLGFFIACIIITRFFFYLLPTYYLFDLKDNS